MWETVSRWEGCGSSRLTSEKAGGPPYVTGPEAYEAGLIEVSELDPPEVPLLSVTNLADVPILLVEGELLIGGDQDRTMNVTVLCPPQVPDRRAGLVRRSGPVGIETGRCPPRTGMPRDRCGPPRRPTWSRGWATSPSRRSDQHRVWDEVERQSIAHGVDSETSALQDVQSEVADRMADELDRIEPVSGQIGVVCTVGDEIVGMDLFDKPTTLETYLRGIIAGHALDAPASSADCDPIRAIERFLVQVDTAARDTGRGVGLGEEILLHGDVAGIGLTYKDRLIHLAAFMAPA